MWFVAVYTCWRLFSFFITVSVVMWTIAFYASGIEFTGFVDMSVSLTVCALRGVFGFSALFSDNYTVK